MEYKTDKRTKNLTLRDIHVGDWVQVWSEETERYSPPVEITQICDDGTIYLVTDDEERCTPWEENIKDIDALPIDADLIRGFGFEISDVCVDRDVEYRDIHYGRQYIGQLRFPFSDCGFLKLCGYHCRYMHDFIGYLFNNYDDIKLEWKGIEK